MNNPMYSYPKLVKEKQPDIYEKDIHFLRLLEYNLILDHLGLAI